MQEGANHIEGSSPSARTQIIYLKEKNMFKEEKKCAECKGFGGGHQDYLNSDGNWESGTGDFVKCENCSGTGLELDEEIVCERIMENLNPQQEEKLQQVFMKGEGWACNKDNCDDLFENWLTKLEVKDYERILKVEYPADFISEKEQAIA